MIVCRRHKTLLPGCLPVTGPATHSAAPVGPRLPATATHDTPPLPAGGGTPTVPGRLARALAALDGLANRIYSSSYNPLYRSGAITVWLLLVLVVTGLYLLLFYRVGAPYASVVRIAEQAWLGKWIRTVHRLAADAALVAAALHALRMLAHRRTWGRRALAWMSGVALVGLILICGWTGYVMVWDVFGRAIAVESARVLDLLPLFSEPLGRAFVGERAVPGAFFFLNLFLHVALPIGVGIALMLHVSRVARPVLLPSRRAMAWGSVALVIAALAWPAPVAPEGDALRLPSSMPVDLFYAFWLPAVRDVALPAALGAGALALTGVLLVPRFSRPAAAERAPASVVNERLCTGCEQCALDCPYEAISMVPRSDRRATLVARVDPAVCVSCGICAGSCAPMGIGPVGRTGRDQLAAVRTFIAERQPGPRDVVVIACRRGAGGAGAVDSFAGAPVLPVDCAGSVHSSVVEYLVRAGAGGVLVMACPVEDCWNREGAVWLEQRLYQGREAELQERVDRRRVALVNLALSEGAAARRAVEALRDRVAQLDEDVGEDEFDLLRLCETVDPAAEDVRIA